MFGWFFRKNKEVSFPSSYEKKLEEKNNLTKILYPIGEKFISVSNDFEVNPSAETYSVLEVVDYCELTNEKIITPVFKDKNGEEFISFLVFEIKNNEAKIIEERDLN